ncbi:MAG: N-acetylmuramoyl-L-alanine amidase [Clostridia bacterium]|nr:N-acetylmuramoyl-L-alanine amidase [Clostridia bacterium]
MGKNRIMRIAAAVLAVATAGLICWQMGVFEFSGKPKICLDAGHGGSDVGAEYNGRYEKDDNLKLTLAVGEILEENGVKVIYTRTEDETVELEERAEFANKKKATYFVSIHRNSAAANVSGVEIWIENTATLYEERLAKDILDEIDAAGFGKNRGVKRGYQGDSSANYLVNSATEMPSCLVEMGFITTPADNKLFDEKLDEYAKAIAEGIMKNLEVEENSTEE